MLRTALGPEITAWLEDASVIEVMLNPDGRLWIDRLGAGIADTGSGMCAADGERIIRLVAHHVGAEVHAKAPRVSAELPDTGERFEGLLPPVVAAPSFAIRKPAVAVFTLADYVSAQIMSPWQADALVRAVAARKNILVAGGTSTGKTTLTNALLAEVAKPRRAPLRLPPIFRSKRSILPTACRAIGLRGDRCACSMTGGRPLSNFPKAWRKVRCRRCSGLAKAIRPSSSTTAYQAAS